MRGFSTARTKEGVRRNTTEIAAPAFRKMRRKAFMALNLSLVEEKARLSRPRESVPLRSRAWLPTGRRI
jgi:hypothetical protein